MIEVESAILLDNGILVHKLHGGYVIRRVDPEENIDGKWDIYHGGNWGSQSCDMFPDASSIYTKEEAVRIGKIL